MRLHHRLILGCGLLVIFGAAALQAHELFITTSAEGWRLMHGHADGDDTHGPSSIPVASDMIAEARSEPTAAKRRAGESVIGDTTDFERLRVRLKQSCWTKTAQGTLNICRDQVERPLASWISAESLTCLRRWRPDFNAATDSGLVISPLDDPFAVRVGRKLRLRITLDGQPAAGAVITYDGRPRGVTAADGEINIKLRHEQRQLIGATLRRPLDEIADEIIHTTYLQFQLEAK